MAPLTLELSPEVLRQLERCAQQRGIQPTAIAQEILERELGERTRERDLGSEGIRIRSALRKAGLTRPVSRRLVDKYVRVRDPRAREAMRQRLQQKRFEPTLSEIIVEDRGQH